MWTSFVGAAANVAIGYAIAVLTQFLAFPHLRSQPRHRRNLRGGFPDRSDALLRLFEALR